ncbi:MAG: hypothetical protein UZ21_OP11001000479 [Microgenomates bacterium OLB22]|nr:MAG: hypothetical protein UZ21_OP11001000479 [Microgenomates bacterium OLB22]
MTDDTKNAYSSLSNDLFRVASLSQRGSHQAAQKFLIEAKRWALPLKNHVTPNYISNIVRDVSSRTDSDISLASAEQYLMYGILLQNYTLHAK